MERLRTIGVWSILLLSMALSLASTTAWAEYPVLQKPKGGPCIRDTQWMRRNHMDLLRTQRDMTVRQGVRVKEESLLNCQSCHPSREQFCDKCHGYVGVQPDCFDCHNYPK